MMHSEWALPLSEASMFRQLLLPVELLLLLGHSFAEGCRLYKCQLSWFVTGID